MSNLTLTILIAFILMLLVTAALAAGLLLTGKSRLRKGCGMRPIKKEKKDDSSSCPLCGSGEPCDEEKDDDSDNN